MITINPADAVKLPKLQKPEVKYYDSEQVSAFLSAAKESHLFAAFYLELATGLRRGELLGLRWKDVNLAAKTVTINQGLVRTKEGLVFQPPKTKQSQRTISIPADVAEALNFYQARQGKIKDDAGSAWIEESIFLNKEKPEVNDLVFCNELGLPLGPRSFVRHFEGIINKYNSKIEKDGIKNNLKQEEIEAAKLPKISFHGLRHTFATLSLQQGVDMRTTSANLGHYDPGFTLSVYSGVTAKMKQDATDKIGTLLKDCISNH